LRTLLTPLWGFPGGYPARLAVVLEALIGQLYPAITLAWLVSMEIVSRTQKKQVQSSRFKVMRERGLRPPQLL